MSRDLYTETEQLTEDLRALGHLTWAEELIGVRRGRQRGGDRDDRRSTQWFEPA